MQKSSHNRKKGLKRTFSFHLIKKLQNLSLRVKMPVEDRFGLLFVIYFDNDLYDFECKEIEIDEENIMLCIRIKK